MPTSERIFVFTATNAVAYEHVDVSIRKPIEFHRIERFFADGTALKRVAKEIGLYAWGAMPRRSNKTRWDALAAGDWVLCEYDGDYRYVAQVVAKFNNDAFARRLWGSDSNGGTWSLVYFLTKPIAIYVPVQEMVPFLRKRYMGFSKISDNNIQRIESKFGSVRMFIERQFLQRPTVTQITREHVSRAFKAFDGGMSQRFRQVGLYELTYEGRSYPPKAIYALANQLATGHLVDLNKVSSGENSKCFRALQELGFVIHLKTR